MRWQPAQDLPRGVAKDSPQTVASGGSAKSGIGLMDR